MPQPMQDSGKRGDTMPTRAWVYAGEHYGRIHRLVSMDQYQRVTFVHDATGYTVIVLRSDVEFCPPAPTAPPQAHRD